MSASSVFTYGTLQIPAVMQAVTGQKFNSVPATLNGYQRLKIKDKTYPGIIQNPDNSIDGMLYRDIDDQILALLDKFEDVCYERVVVDVMVENKTEKTFVYVWKDEYKNQLSNKDWDLEEFKRKYLKLYLKNISSN